MLVTVVPNGSGGGGNSMYSNNTSYPKDTIGLIWESLEGMVVSNSNATSLIPCISLTWEFLDGTKPYLQYC